MTVLERAAVNLAAVLKSKRKGCACLTNPEPKWRDVIRYPSGSFDDQTRLAGAVDRLVKEVDIRKARRGLRHRKKGSLKR
jgi:hypothetical protein